MEFEKLPNDNDAIILGTGMIESIVSAALSRIELNVLNMDKNDYYGGSWGSFNLSGMKEFLNSKDDINNIDYVMPDDVLGQNERFIPFSPPKNCIKNIQEFDYSHRYKVESMLSDLKIESCPADVKPLEHDNMDTSDVANDDAQQMECEEKKYKNLYDEMTTKQRYFVLDLLPKMMYSQGALIGLLISSDVARYCEFKLVTRILTIINDQFVTVPGSRSEVFSTSSVSVMDKRMLMKFLNFALEFEKHEDEYKDHELKTFVEFLKEKKLSPILQHFIQHAIAMSPHDASVVEGLANTKKYLKSLGRYGNSALLTPLYGTGELLQCFCRMSAVFGGVYCLRRTLSGAIVEGKKVVAVLDSQGQRINTKWLLLESCYASQFVNERDLKTSYVSRAIMITDKSVHPDKEKHISLTNIPSPIDPCKHIIIQELPPSSKACPENFYVVHLTCEGSNAASDLNPFVEKHFHIPGLANYEMSDSKPNVMWMVYFNIQSNSSSETSFENVLLVPGADHSLDCDLSISTAEQIFKRVCPDKEFLPKAPSPEDIVFHDAGEVNQEVKAEDVAMATDE